jgi:hypothetical protein
MSTTSTSKSAGSATQRDSGNRAQAPIRWPKADATTIGATAVWVVGLVVALAVPALIVPPGSRGADPTDIWTAFAVSVVGAALVLFSMGFLWKRKGEAGLLILGLVPAFATVSGGIIFATTMLSRG